MHIPTPQPNPTPSLPPRIVFRPGANPHHIQGPLGSPISSSPTSSISYDEIRPASISSPPLSPPPPPGTTYNTAYSPSYTNSHGTFTNSMFENTPAKRMQHPGLVRNLDPSFGINETSCDANVPVTHYSDHSIIQNPLVPPQAPVAATRAGPSRISHHNVPASSEPGPRIPGRPVVRSVPTPPTQVTDLLIPVIHYTGLVDVHIFPTIGQDINSASFDPCNGKFQVLGLTCNVLILVKTCDVDHMLHVFECNPDHFLHVTDPLVLLHQKLELLCNEMNMHNVLSNGNDLTIAVMPNPLKSLLYSWYTMPEGGAYVYDSWSFPLLFNPNIDVLHKYEPGFGRGEG
jgi:hypothetical protein